ncbi:MAG: hypothetical protein EHM36_04305 [Deltaproteobacteria bacterium]|nr:MAG: hypothetical protein EHM36_04305 [Deltaproteobacteria bacterium]
MTKTKGIDNQDLMDKLSQAIEDWETSPYYLSQEELFDLEGFLVDNKAIELKAELETIYGTPLNQKFWSSFLAFHRLKKAREEFKAQEAVQEEKRRKYLQAVEEEKKEWQRWLKEWFHQHRRQQIRVLPGGKKGE